MVWHHCDENVNTVKCPHRRNQYDVITAQFWVCVKKWLKVGRQFVIPSTVAEEAAAGWFFWISWVVVCGLIRGFSRRRGGRLGNSGLYSQSLAEHLYHWYETRILCLAHRLLRGKYTLVMKLMFNWPSCYQAPTPGSRSIGWGLALRSCFHIGCVMTRSHCSTMLHHTIQTV